LADDREKGLERELEKARARVVAANRRPLDRIRAGQLLDLRNAAYSAWVKLEEYRRSRMTPAAVGDPSLD
jgi:hypothetical protein